MKKTLLWMGLGWLAIVILFPASWFLYTALQKGGVNHEISMLIVSTLLYALGSFVAYGIILGQIKDWTGSDNPGKIFYFLAYLASLVFAGSPLIDFIFQQSGLRKTFPGAFIEKLFYALIPGAILWILILAHRKPNRQESE